MIGGDFFSEFYGRPFQRSYGVVHDLVFCPLKSHKMPYEWDPGSLFYSLTYNKRHFLYVDSYSCHQRQFITNYIFDAIRTIDNVIEHTMNISGILVAIDFEKAFDRQ